MTRAHLGVPLQLPDGLIATHNPQVSISLSGPAPDPASEGWWAYLLDEAGADASPIGGLLQLLDVHVQWDDLDPGDVLVGTLGDLLDVPGLPVPASELVQRLVEHFSLVADVVTEAPIYLERPTGMRWITTQIMATIGGVEQMVHTINWQDDGPYSGDGIGHTNATAANDAALQSFSNAVATAWQTAWTTNRQFADASGTNPRTLLGTTTHYDLVRTGLYEQTVPSVPLGDWKRSDGPNPNAGKQVQVGRTVESSINIVGTGSPLPLQVAGVATLRTAAAQTGGPSHGRRNRGRTYLGGFSTLVLTANAPLFIPGVAAGLGSLLGDFFNDVHTATDKHAAVISRAALRGVAITGIEFGTVPDTQRRRRNKLVEVRPQIWSGQLDTVTVS